MHGGEGRAGLYRHVDAAVLAEFVPGVGQGFDRVFDFRVLENVTLFFHGSVLSF